MRYDGIQVFARPSDERAFIQNVRTRTGVEIGRADRGGARKVSGGKRQVGRRARVNARLRNTRGCDYAVHAVEQSVRGETYTFTTAAESIDGRARPVCHCATPRTRFANAFVVARPRLS